MINSDEVLVPSLARQTSEKILSTHVPVFPKGNSAKKLEKYHGQVERKEKIVNTLTNFFEKEEHKDVVSELKRQMEIDKNISDKDLERIARGHIFERLALGLMFEGEEEKLEVSNNLLEVIRNPYGFLDKLEQEANDSPDVASSQRVIREVARVRRAFEGKFGIAPSNNDAIVMQFSEGDVGFSVHVTGSLEMKNYSVDFEDKEDRITKQLNSSRRDTVYVINQLSNLFGMKNSDADKVRLPSSVSVEKIQDFSQIVVQPQGTTKYNDESILVGISKNELGSIYDVLVPLIVKSAKGED
jgi:hypothetical protein